MAEAIHLPERSFEEALAAAMAMPHPERGVTLRNGASARIRAIRPDDEPRLMALCRRSTCLCCRIRSGSLRC